jgi:osmoprotectant transport system permease protein
MTNNIADRFAELPDLLAGHLLLSVSALVIGVVVSVPLGIAATRHPRLRGPALAFAGLIQTVPSMALLALMVPLLGGLIGFVPAFIALTLYSMLPVLRNTVTGILEIDPAMTEAARGVGMTDRQSLLWVELPLAAPIIIAGIRTATVWVVGMATLSTPVGAPSLGNYIFLGLQTRNSVAVLFGCFFAAALAIVLDQLIRLMEHAARLRSPRLAWAAGIGLMVILIGGLLPAAARLLPRPGTPEVREIQAAAGGGESQLSLAGQDLTVGSKGFTEQYILADLLSLELEAAGATVRQRPNMGSTILFDALRSNTVDVSVDYSGTIWAAIMKRPEPVDRTEMLIDVAKFLKDEYGVIALGRLGFENAYALAMNRDRASALGARRSALGARRISDLSQFSHRLTLGGDPEFFGRLEWSRVRQIYGLESMRTRGMDSTFMYGAVRDGEVDVITAYSTDGRIAAFDLVVLDDPKQAFPPYDAILLLSPRAARNQQLIRTLLPLVNAVTDDMMRSANKTVDIDGLSVERAATDLRSRIVGRVGGGR